MHDQEKSDSAIVAVKSPNKTGFPVAEAMERRAGTKGNADEQSTHRTQIRARVTQALGRVRQADQRFAVNTQGRSRMLESGSSGSVRGVLSNEHPYREPGPISDIIGHDPWTRKQKQELAWRLHQGPFSPHASQSSPDRSARL
jgi:hypothetical protein